MKTTYTVSQRYFDRFAGLHMHPGYSVVLYPERRIVEFLNDNGVSLTNENHSPTDDDFSFVKGEYEKLAAEGKMKVATSAKKAEVSKSDPPPNADDAAKQDPPKSDPPPDNPPKKSGK